MLEVEAVKPDLHPRTEQEVEFHRCSFTRLNHQSYVLFYQSALGVREVEKVQLRDEVIRFNPTWPTIELLVRGGGNSRIELLPSSTLMSFCHELATSWTRAIRVKYIIYIFKHYLTGQVSYNLT